MQRTLILGFVLFASISVCKVSDANECTKDADCPGGFCQNGACHVPEPTPAPEPAAMPSAPPGDGCVKDTDCKGDRICQSGTCTSPTPSTPVAAPIPTPATGCTKDTECKGDRVCQAGECVDDPTSGGPQPAPVVAPVTTPPPVAQPAGRQPQLVDPASANQDPFPWYQKGYVEIGELSSIHSWGTWQQEDDDTGDTDDGKAERGLGPGFRIAGYGAASPGHFYIGGFYMFYKTDLEIQDEDGDEIFTLDARLANAMGLTLKAGARPGERAFVGFAIDIGLLIAKYKDDDLYDDSDTNPLVGVMTFPRLTIDIMLLNQMDTGFKMGLNISAGMMIEFASGHLIDDVDITFSEVAYGPTATIGLQFGG